jgi:hypothetical protein
MSPRPPALPATLTAQLAAEVDGIAAAWKRITELVDGVADPATALLAASTAAELVADLHLPAKGLTLRGRQARRWREQEELSLAGLGRGLDQLGLGEPGTDKKPLAAKLVRAGLEEGDAP